MKTSVGTAVLVFLGSVALFFYGMEMVAPIVLAVLLFFLLDPVVSWLERWKIPRVISSLFLMLLSLVVMIACGKGIYDGGARLTAQIPRYSEKVQALAKSFERKANEIQKNTEKLLPSAPVADDTQKVQVVSNESASLGSTLFRGVNSVFSMVANLLLIPILAVFFLLEKNYLRTHLARSFGEAFPIGRVSSEISGMVKAYFVGNMVIGGITAVGFYILFWFLGLENRFALALLAGFLNLVPIFGAFIGAIFPAAQALLQFDHFTEIFIIFGASITFHVIVNSVIIPKMIGARTNVNASAATLGLVFWGWLWGGLGLLLAIPLMALIRIGLSAFPATQSWSNLIAENAELPVFKVRTGTGK